MENDKKRFDFVASLVMLALSVYVIFESVRMYQKAGKVLYLSPALVPLMLGILLCLLSMLLLLGSLKNGGFGKRLQEIKEYFSQVAKDSNTSRMLIGVLLMALYTFVLIEILPFWISTFIFMFLLMYFLEAGSLVKISVISAGAVALIIFLFQVCFRVPLP